MDDPYTQFYTLQELLDSIYLLIFSSLFVFVFFLFEPVLADYLGINDTPVIETGGAPSTTDGNSGAPKDIQGQFAEQQHAPPTTTYQPFKGAKYYEHFSPRPKDHAYQPLATDGLPPRKKEGVHKGQRPKWMEIVSKEQEDEESNQESDGVYYDEDGEIDPWNRVRYS
jgi:hypothetical protein